MGELMCIYDSRKSFGGKAIFVRENGRIKLYSYNTLVAMQEDSNFVIYNVPKVFSNTTVRHIREFYRQFIENRPITIDELREYLEK